jgi:murein L,D-transpeptidase YafK
MSNFRQQSLPFLALCLLASSYAAAGELLVHKEQRSLTYTGDNITREFRISLGSAPVGAKQQQGDRKTPEGVYYIMNKNPRSQFHLSLGISYPNMDDAREGLRTGLISKKEHAAITRAIRRRLIPPQNTRMGGAIYIHGGGTQTDWTWGCIALDDRDMDFLFQHVRVGDKITILR